MASRRTRRMVCARFGALALMLAVVAGCTTSTTTPGASIRQGWPFASGGVHVVVPTSSGAVGTGAIDTSGPRTTAVPVTVDAITARYDYRDELLTPLAHLYGLKLADFVIVTIDNQNAAAVKITVMSEIGGYTEKHSDTVTVAAGKTKEVRQNPRLTTAAYDTLSSAHQADLHVVVSYLDQGQPRTILDQTSETLVTSRRDFPWKIGSMPQQDDYNLLTAMVTPLDPGVEALDRAAANYNPNHIMTGGYDSTDDTSGTVRERLSDVWQAETTDYNLTYISTTDSFAADSQRIRLPAEVLDQSSGNCIELTLLYASIAEAMGMQPVLILLPTHAFVAIRVDNTSDSYYFIETTMIGQATFHDATTEALSEWSDAQASVLAGDPGYGWVDVATERAKGITPIPWH